MVQQLAMQTAGELTGVAQLAGKQDKKVFHARQSSHWPQKVKLGG